VSGWRQKKGAGDEGALLLIRRRDETTIHGHCAFEGWNMGICAGTVDGCYVVVGDPYVIPGDVL
jgi:hypothetical protein